MCMLAFASMKILTSWSLGRSRTARPTYYVRLDDVLGLISYLAVTNTRYGIKLVISFVFSFILSLVLTRLRSLDFCLCIITGHRLLICLPSYRDSSPFPSPQPNVVVRFTSWQSDRVTFSCGGEAG